MKTGLLSREETMKDSLVQSSQSTVTSRFLRMEYPTECLLLRHRVRSRACTLRTAKAQTREGWADHPTTRCLK